MTRLDWAKLPHTIEAGLDRGVLYPKADGRLGDINAVNLIYNPNPDLATYWRSSSSTNAPATFVIDSDGNKAVRFTRATTAAIALYGGRDIGVPAPVASANAGETWTLLFSLKSSIDQTVQTRVGYGTGSSSAQTVTRTMVAGVKQQIRQKYTIATGAASIGSQLFPSFAPQDTATIGAWIEVSKVLWVKGSYDGGYFDGDSDDAGMFTYDWADTQNASFSRMRDVLDLAVPWVGLTSVDEEGQESAATYYIDGRPFLHLPKPKEFSATLKAYTYPDEFAQIMGLEEIADGMFLDSQLSSSFDLSYRTLVSGAADAKPTYKIHLVYNATATADGFGYASLSDSVNANEFSWQIQAVPVAVQGYRPTAHVVINTKHMDPARLYQVESILYGTPAAAPRMPSPDEILDLLTFGDAIIITDNGDGTWTAEGSYENIYLIDDGVFQIDNVDAVLNTDGTYTITSTNVS